LPLSRRPPAGYAAPSSPEAPRGGDTRQTRLKPRPVGMPTADNFELVESPRPEPQDGQVLRRTIYLSLDPYMRGRMSDAPSYAPPVNVGDVMCGHTVSEVVASRHPAYSAGDLVAG